MVSSDRFLLLVSVEFSNLVYDYSGYARAAGYVDTYEFSMFFIFCIVMVLFPAASTCRAASVENEIRPRKRVPEIEVGVHSYNE